MSELTVVVIAQKDPQALKFTLESLCEQSVEEFEVLIVQCGEAEENLRLIREYCDEYVGFFFETVEQCSVPAARNYGAGKAESPLLLFITEGDYLAPDSVESILKTQKETDADIISPRLYVSGENEPYYDTWMDMLATVPHIDRFDRALLNTLDAEGRVYKKKFFDLYSVRFPDIPAFFNTVFTAECVLKCGATAAGAAGAIFDDKHGTFADGFADDAPDGRLLRQVIGIYDDIVETVRALIEEETGSFDGDEYTFQEIVFVYFSVLTDRFYRYFWYLTDEDLQLLLTKYEALTALMTKERQDKIAKTFADLRFPSMYMKREDAAKLPMVSLLADFTEEPASGEFVRSLYTGKFPFFELFLRESCRQYVDEQWQKNENLHFLEDGGFFAAARKTCRALDITVRDPAPLDPRILSELAVVKAPRSFYQYLFASKRKKYSAKTFLKKKGMNMT